MKYNPLKNISFNAVAKTIVASFFLLTASSYSATPGTSVPELKAEIMSNVNKFGVQATMLAVEGKGAQLAGSILQVANVAKSLEGCEMYVVFLSKDTPDLLLLTEAWSSPEAHAASLRNEEIRAIIENASPLIKSVEHKTAIPLGGKGI